MTMNLLLSIAALRCRTARLALVLLTAAALAPTLPVPSAESPASPTAPATSAAPALPLTEPKAAASTTNSPASTAETGSVNSPDRPTRDSGDASRSDRSERRSRRSGTSDRRRDRSEEPAAATAEDGRTNSVVSVTDFSAFKIISERNIFNPNRGRNSARADREAARKPVQIDLITLVGALSYAKGDFAFFDGSQSKYRKVVKCGDSVGDFAVKSITPSKVSVEGGGKVVELQIGAQLRREDEGEWKLIPRADAAPTGSGTTASSSTTASNNSSNGSPASAGGAANDILERLRKKREQENQ